MTQEKARPNSSFRGQRKPSYETDDSIDPETAPEVEAGTHDLDFCEGGKDDGGSHNLSFKIAQGGTAIRHH